MPGEMLPPVIASITLNMEQFTAGTARVKAETAGMAASIDKSTASASAGAAEQAAAMGASADEQVAAAGRAAAASVESSAKITAAQRAAGAAAAETATALGLSADEQVAASDRAMAAQVKLEEESVAGSSRISKAFTGLGSSMSNFGIPFGKSVSKMGSDIETAESKSKGFASAMMSVGKVGAAAGLLLAVGIGVASVKAADQFDVVQTRLRVAVQDTGRSFAQFEPQILKTEKAGTNFGFTMTETAESMAKLTVATRSPTKAAADMGTAMDLARFKNISLGKASETLTKVMAGSNRALMQLGINLNIGSAKLATIQKATEAVTKAKQTLVTAEHAVAEAVKKGAEEHQAAMAKVTAAEETLKGAQTTLKGGSEGLASAQNTLKEAEKGVTEAAEKQKVAVKEAAAALKAAEESARETAEAGAKGIEGAKKNLSALEQERAKESNEAGIKTIEGEEKVLEATKTAASESALVQLRSKKESLEATDKGMEATKKEEALQTAHKGIIEAEASAHKNNAKAMTAVEAAHQKLVKAQQEEIHGSKESAAAATKLATAHKGVATAEQTLVKDQEAVTKATRGVSSAQEAANKTSTAVVKAEEKLKAAHEALSKAVATQQKDATTVQKVMEALHNYLGGQAAAHVKTLAGQWEVFKAKLNETEIALGNKLLPTLQKLMPIFAKIGLALVSVVGFMGTLVAGFLTGWQKMWEVIGLFYYQHLQPIVSGIIKTLGGIAAPIVAVVKWFVHMDIEIAKVFVKIVSDGVKLVGWFIALPGKIMNALSGLAASMFKLGKDIVKSIVEGIENAPSLLIKALEKLIPGGSAIAEAAGGVEKLFEGAGGAIITKRTLLIAGEKGPEALVPLSGGISADSSGISPLPASPSSPPASPSVAGSPTFNTNIYGANQTDPEIVNALYLALRPMLQGA